jgi:hypothetical protein
LSDRPHDQPQQPVGGGSAIPGYQLERVIGSGGFSHVYEAYQVAYDRTVAVKVLAVDLTDRRSQDRFTREVTATGRLTGHPNIVTVLDAGFTTTGQPYLTTPLLTGSAADRLTAQGPLPLAEVLRIGVKLAGALETAHQHSILHRDIKPANVLISSYGEPALADFGIAAIDQGLLQSVTLGALTPEHAAPEVVDNQRADAAADIYSLGSTLYTLLAGRPPHSEPGDESMVGLLRRILSDPVPPVGRSDVPASLDAALAHAMEKSADERFGSARELGEALQGVERELGLPVTELVWSGRGGATHVGRSTAAPAWGTNWDDVNRGGGTGPGSSEAMQPGQPVGRAQTSNTPTVLPGERSASQVARAPVPERPGRDPDAPWRRPVGRDDQLPPAEAIGAAAAGVPASGEPPTGSTVILDRSRQALDRGGDGAPDTTERATRWPLVIAGVVAAAIVAIGLWFAFGRSGSHHASPPPPHRAPAIHPVNGLRATRDSTGRVVHVTWIDTNGGTVHYYVVVEPPPPGTPSAAADSSTGTKVEGLDPATRYCFTIQAFTNDNPTTGLPQDLGRTCVAPGAGGP